MDNQLKHYFKPILNLFEDKSITEICISPEIVFYEVGAVWEKIEIKELNKQTLENIAKIVASTTKQNITENRPILSAYLEDDERIQISLPPASLEISITIRKPSYLSFSLEDFEQQGAFQNTISTTATEINDNDKQLLELLKHNNYKSFLSFAVKNKYNIICSGATGSGKTTFMKGLIQEIPLKERIITIEDVPELNLPHENCVRLIYSKDAKSASDVTPKMLLESCLRMRPDRILLAELRGEEAFYYLRNVNSGHPGSITSIHANSPIMAFDQLMLYIKESEAGKNLAKNDISTLLYLLIDIIVQFTKLPDGRRVVSEIYFDPKRKLELSQS